jgi:hypothetical protein
VYGWIWRHLPFGLPGKIAGSVLLIAAAGALLWYQAFPAIEPLLPFYDGQVTQDGGPAGGPGPGSAPAPGSTDASVPPPDVIPYPTTSNNTSPRPTRPNR